MSAALEFRRPVAAVDLVDVGRRYGDFWALREVTMALPAGSITAVVGPNGAGKTTMLNLLVGLLPASTGQLRVAGESPNSGPGFLSRVGFVAQDCPLYGDFTVTDLLRFGRSMNPTWDDDLARDRLAAAEVPLDRKAGRLSGGQRAQVALAIAVAKRPERAAARRTVGRPGPDRPPGVPPHPGRHRRRVRDDGDAVLPPRRGTGPGLRSPRGHP